MKPTHKATDQKWTIWDCPDEPFVYNKEFFRFAIQLPLYDPEKKTIEIYIRPSYTLSQDSQSLFTCVYEMEYEITVTDELLSAQHLADIIISDCYPCFSGEFNEQKEDFPAAQSLHPPQLTAEIRTSVLEGSRKALADAGYPV